ncbi:hypothetical protein THOM_0575 [Trachipleistophora hominis]|uniref:Uncharacterized protein n=1 Tax=Trachipleistophora hominis TaxID=72359 RepID=L7JZI5_TRAHO|nr:hypothetical protein THOM_0575 [Trachipleistophora hominis]
MRSLFRFVMLYLNLIALILVLNIIKSSTVSDGEKVLGEDTVYPSDTHGLFRRSVAREKGGERTQMLSRINDIDTCPFCKCGNRKEINDSDAEDHENEQLLGSGDKATKETEAMDKVRDDISTLNSVRDTDSQILVCEVKSLGEVIGSTHNDQLDKDLEFEEYEGRGTCSTGDYSLDKIGEPVGIQNQVITDEPCSSKFNHVFEAELAQDYSTSEIDSKVFHNESFNDLSNRMSTGANEFKDKGSPDFNVLLGSKENINLSKMMSCSGTSCNSKNENCDQVGYCDSVSEASFIVFMMLVLLWAIFH